MIRAILWDNDGVLVDTERLYFLATRRTLASVGVDLGEGDYRRLFLRQGRGAWHLAAARGVGADRIERLKEERSRVYTGLLARRRLLIEGVRETLERLRGRYQMGVVTSSHRDHFDRIHRRTGLRRFFDFVVAAGDYRRFKPAPDPYRTALARAGVRRHECVAVEDSERGLASAVGAGLRCFVIPRDLSRGGRFQRAFKVLEDVRELPAEIRRLDGGGPRGS